MDELVETRASKITAELRRQIQSGDLAAGERVPSTREIMRRWGVAMATATKVLAALKAEGLVRTRPGVGTVVAGSRPPRARANRRARNAELLLSRDRIVGAAIAVADEEGLGALSMRRVAVELNVATMSLYRHVRDKEDLINGMMDAAFAEWQMQAPKPGRNWQDALAEAARELWQVFRRHLWLAPAYSLTRPSLVPSGLAYTERVLATLLGLGVKPVTAFSMHLILFSYIRGFASSLEMEAAAEAETGVSADEWMDVQMPALESLLANHDLPAFRTVLGSFEPAGFDLDVDELFEVGLGYLLDGFRLAQ
jgi:AcrR family transcriptional regulator